MLPVNVFLRPHVYSATAATTTSTAASMDIANSDNSAAPNSSIGLVRPDDPTSSRVYSSGNSSSGATKPDRRSPWQLRPMRNSTAARHRQQRQQNQRPHEQQHRRRWLRTAFLLSLVAVVTVRVFRVARVPTNLIIAAAIAPNALQASDHT